MNDRDRDWFAPLWRRVLVVAFLAVWTGWEWLFNHDQLWGTMTAGLLAYAVWAFFIGYKPAPPAADTQEKDDGKPQG